MPEDPSATPAAPPARPLPPPAPVTGRSRRGLSPVWIIPIIAALLGAWLVWKYYSAKGPEITVRFETAEGIVGGKTPVLCRSVSVGTVRGVRLTDDLKNVLVTVDMTRDATQLLTHDTQIWIVRARYSSAGISGLNTLVSGNYIELQPGVSKDPRREFYGLENPPVTPPGVPGLRFRLTSATAGGLGPGASINYKGIPVGKIETRKFHPESGDMEFGAFIQSDYANLIESSTRFWNSSGIDLKVGAEGVQLRSGTLESILAGGITFSDPEHKQTRRQIADGRSFVLYDSFDATRRTEFNPTVPYLLLFTGSVRGLSVDAPVEFRGIQVGTVSGISFKYLPADPERRAPVLIKIDPAALVNVPAGDDYTAAETEIAKSVEKGLRASLKTGSLITGQLYVDLDFQKDPTPLKVEAVEGYHLLPTASGGLDELVDKVSALLDKFQKLPVEKTIDNLNDTLAAAKGAVSSLDTFLSSADTQALPTDLRKDLQELQKTLAGYNGESAFYGDLSQTLRQLTDTLRSVKALTGTLERSPNSLIFGKPGGVAPPRGSR